MTTHELARKLLELKDAPVHFSYPLGDFWDTWVAPEITKIEEIEIQVDPKSKTAPIVVTPDVRVNQKTHLNNKTVFTIG